MRNLRPWRWIVLLGLLASAAPLAEAESASAQAQVLIIIPERRKPPQAPAESRPVTEGSLEQSAFEPASEPEAVEASVVRNGDKTSLLYTKLPE